MAFLLLLVCLFALVRKRKWSGSTPSRHIHWLLTEEFCYSFFFLLVVNAANIYDFCHTQFPAYLVKISITRSS